MRPLMNMHSSYKMHSRCKNSFHKSLVKSQLENLFMETNFSQFLFCRFCVQPPTLSNKNLLQLQKFGMHMNSYSIKKVVEIYQCLPRSGNPGYISIQFNKFGPKFKNTDILRDPYNFTTKELGHIIPNLRYPSSILLLKSQSTKICK